MLYKYNVHAGRTGYQAPGSRFLTQVHTNVHCCHWLPKELSNEGYQTYQRVGNSLLSVGPVHFVVGDIGFHHEKTECQPIFSDWYYLMYQLVIMNQLKYISKLQ